MSAEPNDTNRLTRQIQTYAKVQYVLAAVTLLALGLFYFGVYRPQEMQSQELTRKITAAQTNLTSDRTKTDRLPRVTSELMELKARLAGFKKLPPNPQYGQFLRDIYSAGKEASLQKLVVTPGLAHRAELFWEQPISLTYQGNFSGVWNFIQRVENMQRLTRVRDVTIRVLNARQGMVSVSMSVNIYYASEG
jgi:Tfp pilus assembly protein PilO